MHTPFHRRLHARAPPGQPAPAPPAHAGTPCPGRRAAGDRPSPGAEPLSPRACRATNSADDAPDDRAHARSRRPAVPDRRTPAAQRCAPHRNEVCGAGRNDRESSRRTCACLPRRPDCHEFRTLVRGACLSHARIPGWTRARMRRRHDESDHCLALRPPDPCRVVAQLSLHSRRLTGVHAQCRAPRHRRDLRVLSRTHQAGPLKRDEAAHVGRPRAKHVRRRPTLPRGLPRSTIGAEGLNFRVRNGAGCFPFAMVAETLWRCGCTVLTGLRPYLENCTVDA